MRGCYGVSRSFLCDVCLSIVSMIVRVLRKGEETCVEREWTGSRSPETPWKDGRKGLEGLVVVLFILLSLQLVNLVNNHERCCECE